MIGSGGHAGSLLATLRARGMSCAGCISNSRPNTAGWQDVPWLGGDEALRTLDPAAVYLLNGIGSVGSLNLRRMIFDRAKAEAFTFLTLIHPSAIVERDVELGEGAQVFAGAILQTGAWVGRNCIINSGVIVEHDNRIGDHCHIASGARLSGSVVVGENSHIGTGACIIQDLEIEHHAVVGAGSVVLSNVKRWTKVAGAPARQIRGTLYDVANSVGTSETNR